MDVPLVVLDPEIRRAVDAARGPRGDSNALEAHRRVASRSTYLELAERSGDALAAAAAWHVAVLTLERVLWGWAARQERAWDDATVQLVEPTAHLESPRDVSGLLLRERSRDRRARLAHALERGAGPVADAARELAEKRADAAQRLDATVGPKLHLPFEPTDAASVVARELLDRTEGMAPRAGGWHEALEILVAREAGEGWPAHLTPRWLSETFRGTGLLDGLVLAPAALPSPIGASSFARALRGFGEAIARADVPTGAPFSLAHPPFDLRQARRGALLASVAGDAVFHARVLGLTRASARDQARRVARALLGSLRLDAARTLLDGALARDARELRATFEEATARALGAPVPPELAGVVPRLAPPDATRFAGALLAATDRAALVDKTDDDWFKSPHAARLIREENAVLPASPRATLDELRHALDAVVTWFEAALE